MTQYPVELIHKICSLLLDIKKYKIANGEENTDSIKIDNIWINYITIVDERTGNDKITYCNIDGGDVDYILEMYAGLRSSDSIRIIKNGFNQIVINTPNRVFSDDELNEKILLFEKSEKFYSLEKLSEEELFFLSIESDIFQYAEMWKQIMIEMRDEWDKIGNYCSNDMRVIIYCKQQNAIKHVANELNKIYLEYKK